MFYRQLERCASTTNCRCTSCGALHNGLTREEIVEAIIHATAYCGAPAGLSAMRVVQETLVAELGPRTSTEES